MLYSGIDLHKRSLVVHTLDADGTTTREAELKSDRAAVLAYFGTLAGSHRAVVECVPSWYWLRDLLAPTGVDLRLAHAKYVTAISYAKVRTDRVDARMLAQLLRAGLVPEAHMIGAAHRETRDLLRSRLQLVTRAVRCRHAVGSLLEKYNVSTPDELPELAQMQAALQDEQRALTVRYKHSRDGNRYLKQVFHTAAIRAALYHPEIRQEYRRLARRKGKIVARALIAKDLPSIVYWVLRKQEAFNGKFRGHVLTPKPAVWPRLASPGSLTDAGERRTDEWGASRRAGE